SAAVVGIALDHAITVLRRSKRGQKKAQRCASDLVQLLRLLGTNTEAAFELHHASLQLKEAPHPLAKPPKQRTSPWRRREERARRDGRNNSMRCARRPRLPTPS